MLPTLTRRQQEIYDFLKVQLGRFAHPPTLDELCDALGLKSRGSLHKQIQALIEAGLVEPMNHLRRGIRPHGQHRGIPELPALDAPRRAQRSGTTPACAYTGSVLRE